MIAVVSGWRSNHLVLDHDGKRDHQVARTLGLVTVPLLISRLTIQLT